MSATTHRLPNWQSRLAAAIAERQQRHFKWGEHDCCLFVCDCVHAMTGHDPAADVRGYAGARAAARLVQRLGGMRAIGAARFGAEVHVLQAQLGDVGLVEQRGREALALCAGVHWLAAGECGLVVVPAAEVRASWRCF